MTRNVTPLFRSTQKRREWKQDIIDEVLRCAYGNAVYQTRLKYYDSRLVNGYRKICKEVLALYDEKIEARLSPSWWDDTRQLPARHYYQGPSSSLSSNYPRLCRPRSKDTNFDDSVSSSWVNFNETRLTINYVKVFNISLYNTSTTRPKFAVFLRVAQFRQRNKFLSSLY